MAGVVGVEFDRGKLQTVVVTYDPAQTTPEAIVEAIEQRGDRVSRVSQVP